jgi:predicted ATPase
VQRDALGADSASTYDQANTLLQAGRKAATEEDYVAASGYAEKAATLADKLSSGAH